MQSWLLPAILLVLVNTFHFKKHVNSHVYVWKVMAVILPEILADIQTRAPLCYHCIYCIGCSLTEETHQRTRRFVDAIRFPAATAVKSI